MSNCSGDHLKAYYTYIHTKYIHFIICGIWALGGIFGQHQNVFFCYQKDRTGSRSVYVHSDLTYDASRAHRRGRGDKAKNDIILLVTTRLIAHSGQSQFLRKCVGEFSIDTG